MTTPSNNKKMSKVLLERSKLNKILLKSYDFSVTNIGNGPFISTISGDVIYDLRLSKYRPYCGHSHPICIQHNFNELSHEFVSNFYSVPNNEFTRMIETFQKVDFIDFLDPSFKITYHNVVIDFNEELLNFDLDKVRERLESFIAENRDTFFWIVENDINLLSSDSQFVYQELLNDIAATKHIHLVIKNHFIPSVLIQSHHLFSEDSNMQIYLGLKKYTEEVISEKISGKNTIDYKIIDEFINFNKLNVKRVHRYLKLKEPIETEKLNSNALLTSEISPGESQIISIPIACTNSELLDILEKIKFSI